MSPHHRPEAQLLYKSQPLGKNAVYGWFMITEVPALLAQSSVMLVCESGRGAGTGV